MVKTSRKFTFIVVILAALITMSAAAKNAVVTGKIVAISMFYS
jgi:fructose-specific phosphotransferase system IIC component